MGAIIRLRRSEERGRAELEWLDSRHSFSFDSYYNPSYMGLGALRVLNEDRVAPGKGFPTHGHRDIEIVTYMISGEIEHCDSLGGSAVVRAGDVQCTSAGRGIMHSEYNASRDTPAHFLQMWFIPTRKGAAPTYQQRSLAADTLNQLRLIASSDGVENSVVVNAAVRLWDARLDAGVTVRHALGGERRTWVQVISGEVKFDNISMHAGDGLAVEEIETIELSAVSSAHLVVIDV